MAGSSDFMTPVGYQTNMIVYDIANYHFLDFTVFGFPLMIMNALLSSGICYFLFE